MFRRSHAGEHLDTHDTRHDADPDTSHDPGRDPGEVHREDTHPPLVHDEEAQRERFGGINWGAAFFGWLVAVAVAVLLSSIVGAVAAAVGANMEASLPQPAQDAGTIGIVAAAVLLLLMLVSYYTGGYVAGRMSRFDGGRQGLAVWLIGLLVTILAVALGLAFGAEYNIFDRVNLPTIPIPTDALSWGGVVTAVAVLVGTLLAAIAGGKVGRRYHRKVDDAAFHY